jgi:hypothetical protein
MRLVNRQSAPKPEAALEEVDDDVGLDVIVTHAREKRRLEGLGAGAAGQKKSGAKQNKLASRKGKGGTSKTLV